MRGVHEIDLELRGGGVQPILKFVEGGGGQNPGLLRGATKIGFFGVLLSKIFGRAKDAAWGSFLDFLSREE